jgi:hypothetical protein
VELARAVGCATLLAVTVTPAKPASGLDGAVYLPVASSVPIAVGLTPAGGASDHVTAVLVAPVTLAVNCRVPFTGTITLDVGSIETATAPSATAFAVNSERLAAIIAHTHARTLMSSPLLTLTGFGLELRVKYR